MSDRDGSIEDRGNTSGSSRMAVTGPIIASMAFVLELTLVPLLLPLIQVHFDLSINELVWVFNSYGLAVAFGVLVGGWFGDMFGTRRVFAAGLVCFALGSFLVVLADSFETLLLGRALQGFGGGVFSPLIPLLLVRASPNRPGQVLIIWSSLAGYVAAFAPIIFGQLLTRYSWDLAFLSLAILALVALAVPACSHSERRMDFRINSIRDYSQLLQSRCIWLMYCYVFCTYGAITFHLFRLPVWLSESGVDATGIGLVISTIWLSFALLSTFLRDRVDKPEVHKIMLAAPLLIVVGLPISYFIDTQIALVASCILIGAGLACSNAPSTQMILKFAPERMKAISASLDITFARVGGVVTVALLAHTHIFVATAAIGLLCFVAFLCALTSGQATTAG